ncbi:MAG: DUF6629 family protein [Geitlerinemataceae cyanobacterium]
MCFSASASFTASALLIPTGIYCIRMALHRQTSSELVQDREYLSVSCLPLFFGIQQAFEGLLWLGLDAQNLTEISFSALGFLFFSHFVWLAWIPFSAFALEHNPFKKKILYIVTTIGALYGVFLYFPLLLNRDWLAVRIANHSIDYQVRLIFHDFLRGQQVIWLYVFFIIFPLFVSSLRSLKILGVLILTSAFLTHLSFSYAFISVWCFFAALLSGYVFYMLQPESEPISDRWIARF